VPEPIQRAIVVHGEATVRRVPDLAVVSLAVRARGKQPAPARDEANRRASAILGHLRELGLHEADMQASSLVVHPTYDNPRGGPKITGYEASRPMTLRIRDIDLLGPVLDGLVDDGATQVQDTAMELAEPEAATREALTAALAVARSRAGALAIAAGVSLGDPLRIEEGESVSGPIRPMGMLRMAAAQEAAPTEVAAGEIEVSATVRVWFALG
jgi:uncharacterized protein YggE